MPKRSFFGAAKDIKKCRMRQEIVTKITVTEKHNAQLKGIRKNRFFADAQNGGKEHLE